MDLVHVFHGYMKNFQGKESLVFWGGVHFYMVSFMPELAWKFRKFKMDRLGAIWELQLQTGAHALCVSVRLLPAEDISCQLATTQLHKSVFKKGIFSVPVGFLEVSIAEAPVNNSKYRCSKPKEDKGIFNR